jgi:hypothetical protein
MGCNGQLPSFGTNRFSFRLIPSDSVVKCCKSLGCTSQLAKNPAFITVTQVYHMNGPFAFLSLTPLPFKPWRLRLLELWDDGIIHGLAVGLNMG